MGEELVEGGAFVDAADLDIAAVFGGHQFDGSRCFVGRKRDFTAEWTQLGYPDAEEKQRQGKGRRVL
jgi:hypothetical protein